MLTHYFRLFHRAAVDFDKMKKRNAYIDQFKKADMFKVSVILKVKKGHSMARSASHQGHTNM